MQVGYLYLSAIAFLALALNVAVTASVPEVFIWTGVSTFK